MKTQAALNKIPWSLHPTPEDAAKEKELKDKIKVLKAEIKDLSMQLKAIDKEKSLADIIARILQEADFCKQDRERS